MAVRAVAGRGADGKGPRMTELDVQLSRTVADRIARQRGDRVARAELLTMVAACTLLLASVVVLLVR